MKKLINALLLFVLCLTVVMTLAACGGGDNNTTGTDIADTILESGTYELALINNANDEIQIDGLNWRVVLDNDKNISFFKNETSIQSTYTVTGTLPYDDTYIFALSNNNAILEFFNTDMPSSLTSIGITNFVSIVDGRTGTKTLDHSGQVYKTVMIKFTTNVYELDIYFTK